MGVAIISLLIKNTLRKQMVTFEVSGRGRSHYNRLVSALENKDVPDEHRKWMWENTERIDATVRWLEAQPLTSHCFAEIGPGGVGLPALQKFNDATLDAYDCVEWFKPVYDQFNIPWQHIDLNGDFALPEGKYDVIFLCEVIEHVARWPIEIFEGLKKSLKPGGYLLVTTQNLHRLSNRLRMIQGKKLFADFTHQALVMGHIREYMPEEMDELMSLAGFEGVGSCFMCFPDLLASSQVQAGYYAACRLFPRLSTHFFCWGQKL